MIKKILKYGTVAAASFVTGTIAQVHYLNHKAKGDSPDSKLWQGEDKELQVTVENAEHHIDLITECIDEGNHEDRIFEEQDLRSVRTKLMHGAARAEDNNGDVFSITLHDRERLRWIELWINSEPLLKENSK